MTRSRVDGNEEGASSVEYALLVAFIAAVIVAAVVLFGTQVGSLFDDTCDSVRDNGHLSASCR